MEDLFENHFLFLGCTFGSTNLCPSSPPTPPVHPALLVSDLFLVLGQLTHSSQGVANDEEDDDDEMTELDMFEEEEES